MKITEQAEYQEMMLKYNFAMQRLETELNILLKEYEYKKGYNPVEHIKTRMKSLESALKKLEEKGYEASVDNLVRKVYDMIGVRIVCSFLSDVYDIINIIKSSKQFIIKNESDYIKNPKSSGYTSYHLNILVPVHLLDKTEYVEVEIQIRTVAMDFWASLDHKLRYKLPRNIPEELERQMNDSAKAMIDLDKKMNDLNMSVKEYVE